MSLPVVAVTDDAWELMLRSFNQAQNKDTWKLRMRGRTGAHAVVRFSDGRFMTRRLGMDCELCPSSVARAACCAGVATAVGPVADFAMTAERMAEVILANSTGNHRPQSHPVRVPTAPGQPVRG